MQGSRALLVPLYRPVAVVIRVPMGELLLKSIFDNVVYTFIRYTYLNDSATQNFQSYTHVIIESTFLLTPSEWFKTIYWQSRKKRVTAPYNVRSEAQWLKRTVLLDEYTYFWWYPLPFKRTCEITRKLFFLYSAVRTKHYFHNKGLLVSHSNVTCFSNVSRVVLNDVTNDAG